MGEYSLGCLYNTANREPDVKIPYGRGGMIAIKPALLEDLFGNTIMSSTDIEAGRDTNTSYTPLQVRNWINGKARLINQAKLINDPNTNQNKVIDNLLSQIRDDLSQVEDLVYVLDEYINILDTFNSSSHSINDVNTLISNLQSFKFQ